MELDIDRLYGRMPEGMQTVAQKWFYILDPRRSWAERRKPDATHDAFVERFFEDESEYRRYESEFLEGPVPDAIWEGIEEIDDEYTVFDAHRDECLKYYALVRKFRPDRLVETGVYSGISTLSLLAALEENDHGRLYSVDDSEHVTAAVRNGSETDIERHYTRERPSCAEPEGYLLPPGKEPGWLVPENLRDRWELTTGRSRAELPELLARLDGVDFFLHDSEHSAARMFFEFELAWESLEPGGMIWSSHVDWNDAFETFAEERPCERGLVAFHYFGYRDHEDPTPCSTGYIRKPDR
jgi:hypothetical protein